MDKRVIYITERDMERLQELIEVARDYIDEEDVPYVEELKNELKRAKVVRPQDMPSNVVTMNSRVRVRVMDAGEEMTWTLSFPAEETADDALSVLAPIGTALLGYAEGQVIEWRVPKGLVEFRIEEILYQPEAAGDYQQ